jgi:phage shock protein PspC (stress-responsive transcriptional regulator)
MNRLPDFKNLLSIIGESFNMPKSEKLLRRSKDRIIAGVCGGIAERFDQSPSVVRLIYVLISIFSVAFPGILVYLILWFIMPSSLD